MAILVILLILLSIVIGLGNSYVIVLYYHNRFVARLNILG